MFLWGWPIESKRLDTIETTGVTTNIRHISGYWLCRAVPIARSGWMVAPLAAQAQHPTNSTVRRWGGGDQGVFFFAQKQWKMSWGLKSRQVSLKHVSFRIFYSRLYIVVEGSLEVKLPTIWTVEKQRWEESEEKRSEEWRCRCAKR